MRQKRANEEGAVDVRGGKSRKAAARLAPAQTEPFPRDRSVDETRTYSSPQTHQLWSIHINFSSTSQDQVAYPGDMSANDQPGGGGGGASKPRDIPEYVQRNFKLKEDLQLDKTGEETDPNPKPTVSSVTPPILWSSSPPDFMDVDDNIHNVSLAASPAKSSGGENYRDTCLNEQEMKDEPTSSVTAPPMTFEEKRRNFFAEFGPGLGKSVDELEEGYRTRKMAEQPPQPVQPATVSDVRPVVLESTKSRLQQYADEVYQNTVVKYQERVRRGEETVPTDCDRRTNLMWIERYSAWAAKQEQQKLVDEGLPATFPPPKGGSETQEHQDEGLPEPFPPPKRRSERLMRQDEGLPERFPPTREQRKGG
ncbi:hypothetical protein IWZ00DRAFT_563885 [Phyllosticta capitalensis]